MTYACLLRNLASQKADDLLTLDYLQRIGVDPEEAASLCVDLHVGTAVTVPMRSVSSVIAEHGLQQIGLLKIDVKRVELDVLMGIEEVDWRRVMTVVVEVHDLEGRISTVQGMLSERRFSTSVRQEEWLSGTELWTILARR